MVDYRDNLLGALFASSLRGTYNPPSINVKKILQITLKLCAYAHDLRWDWEVAVPELATSVFIIPGCVVKNGDDRLVVLNRIAHAIVQARRGKHGTHVFAFRGKPVYRMLNSAWKTARTRAELPQVRVHDLKHTFGRRLRAAGVSFEDRQDLLGHRSGRITTHYSAAELTRLIEAADKVCDRGDRKPDLVILKRISVR